MKLYNTLTKQVEEFKPVYQDHVNMYSCGPTVYNYAHIGNLRSFIMADLLYRTLKFDGFKVNWVMNITDIDDKTIKGTISECGNNASVKDLYDFTEKYLQIFINDLKSVNVLVDEIKIIRVTDKMKEIQEFILELINKGYAYKADDGIYFSIEKYQKDFGDYGELVGKKFLEGKKVGARVAVDEYEKDNLSDFALWKTWDEKTDAQIFWDHPVLGKGRPGWHIECSVINQVAFSGQATDIHTGGVDLIFPHHTNEIAQSQPMYKPYVNYWYHNDHLLVDGMRMGKRFKNFYTINDLKEKGYSGQDLRYFFMNSGFNTQQNFTFEALSAARSAREKIFGLTSSAQIPVGFDEAVNDNLNFSKALATVWGEKVFNDKVNSVLGFTNDVADQSIPDNIMQMVAERDTAKKAKDYQKSDELRKQMEDLGYVVKDTADGQKVKKK
jgi:cysteinyl-tRNA synthetase